MARCIDLYQPAGTLFDIPPNFCIQGESELQLLMFCVFDSEDYDISVRWKFAFDIFFSFIKYSLLRKVLLSVESESMNARISSGMECYLSQG